MSRWVWIWGIVLPLGGIPAYFLGLRMYPEAFHRVVLSEQGLVELGTAAFYLVGAAAAVGLAWRTRGSVPQRYRVLYMCYAIAALFVALEELSYGQHLFSWESPAWFAVHNTKGEVNLHNLIGSKPSRVLYDTGHIIFPVGCIVLPLLLMQRREAYTPRHWSYYLMPRGELIAVVVLAGLLGLVRKLALVALVYSAALSELVEFYWGAAALLYVGVMWQRLVSSGGAARSRGLPI
jgi:hypothetical protein